MIVIFSESVDVVNGSVVVNSSDVVNSSVVKSSVVHNSSVVVYSSVVVNPSVVVMLSVVVKLSVDISVIVGVDVSLKFVSFVESIDVTFVRVEFSVVVPFDHVYVVTVEVADLLTIHFPFPPLPPLPPPPLPLPPPPLLPVPVPPPPPMVIVEIGLLSWVDEQKRYWWLTYRGINNPYVVNPTTKPTSMNVSEVLEWSLAFL